MFQIRFPLSISFWLDERKLWIIHNLIWFASASLKSTHSTFNQRFVWEMRVSLQFRMNKVCDNDSEFRFWRISFFWIKITARCSVTKPARCPSRRTLAVRTLHQPNKARSVSWEEGLLRKAFMDTTCWMLGIAEESFRLARCDTASAESIRPLILRYKFTQLLFFESKSAPGASYAEVRLGSLFHTAQGL